MPSLLALVVVLLAALALAYPVAAQSDVTKTVWYARFKQVAATFNAPNFDEWEQHISRNRINFVDTIPRDRSQQLLRTFKAMRDYQDLMSQVSAYTEAVSYTTGCTFNISSTGPYAWLTPEEYQATIGGILPKFAETYQGETLSLSAFIGSLNQSSVVRAPSVDYSARRGSDGTVVQQALALPVPVIGYGCKSSWAVVVADALSLYMQYQRAHSDKARARSDPRTNRGLIASAQQLIDCAPTYPSTGGLRNPCAGNTLASALEYITGRNYATSMPGAAPNHGLNPLSRYGPASSRGTFRGSSDVYQSRGYCAAEPRQSKRFFLDGADEGRGYSDVGDLSAALGFSVSEDDMELLLNYRQPGRSRGRTGPLISSVYAGSRFFQLYSGGVFQNINGLPDSCPMGYNYKADQPVLVMGYYKNEETSSSYWVLRVPFGRTWGERGSMKLAKNVPGMPVPLCGLGTVVGVFLPPNYQLSAGANALAPSAHC